jgi:hypothetical protein
MASKKHTARMQTTKRTDALTDKSATNPNIIIDEFSS